MQDSSLCITWHSPPHIITAAHQSLLEPWDYPRGGGCSSAVKVESDFLLAQGHLLDLKSPGVLLFHVMPKSDSTVRPVEDYRQLNSVTGLHSYPHTLFE
ncbi:hypothetical protein TNCV_2759251 [Trichonephila clavipes]|nr:hypothetical protein TNCV_2759251 [Trichonephila clavipes]